MNPPLLEQFTKAKYVFVGTAMAQYDSLGGRDIRSTADRIAYTFSVEIAWKGVETDTFVVRSARSGISCGYNFENGTQYVVLANDWRGRPSSGMCSGNATIQEAFDARYLFPEPRLIDSAASWPAISRNDLLEHLRTNGDLARSAAILLAEEVSFSGQSLSPMLPLILIDPKQSADLFASNADSTDLVRAFEEIGKSLLDSDLFDDRKAAVAALGQFSQGEELNSLLTRGFADPVEPVRAATRKVLLARYKELSVDQGNEQVAHFMASIEYTRDDQQWVCIHQLRYFPIQKDLILPYLAAMQDTSTSKIMHKTARDVYQELTSDPQARDR